MENLITFLGVITLALGGVWRLTNNPSAERRSSHRPDHRFSDR